MQKLSIPLLKFMYLMSRKRSKRNNLCKLGGGKMSESDYLASMEIVKNIQNGKQ